MQEHMEDILQLQWISGMSASHVTDELAYAYVWSGDMQGLQPLCFPKDHNTDYSF